MEKITQAVESVCENLIPQNGKQVILLLLITKISMQESVKTILEENCIEFNRISAGFIKELEEFIKEKLKVSEYIELHLYDAVHMIYIFNFLLY